MSTRDEVREALDITAGTWNNYIADGVIVKQKATEYDTNEVAKGIIRYQRTTTRKLAGEKTGLLKKLDAALGKVVSGAISGDGGTSESEHDKLKKEIDLEITKEKLIKIRHENKVRKKEVMPVENVFTFVTSIASEFAAFLDPIVGKLKQSVPDMNAKAHDDLTKTMAIGRNNLSRHIEGKTTNEFIQLFNPDSNLGDDDE